MKLTNKNIILAVIAVAAMTALFAACTVDNANDDEDGQEEADLGTVVEKLYQDVDPPPNETINLDETNFEFFAFIPYDDNLSGAAADALVNITPHSLVVIHTRNGNGAELAKQVAENADPNKWLCVRAEALRVAYTDHYVVLVMSYPDTADAIIANFRNMARELDGMEMVLDTSIDYNYE